ncbi:MAG: aldo/keto reductase [Myxococcales bacterium]|nr:aldo/keto reductase [Myxococcales bacterium]
MPQQRFALGGDLDIGRLGFGAMRICGKSAWGWPADRRRVSKVLEAAREGGVNFIDTADAYGPETSEYLLEEALHPFDGLVLATKGGLVRGGPRDWTTDGRPEHLMRACENSLRRLRVSCIDLYQLHAIDDDVPLEESLGCLVELQCQGKIRHIGVSNFSAEELARGQKVATIVSVQNRYNLLDRSNEAVLRTCEAAGIGFIPWYPLATGKLTRESALENIAKKHRAKPGQIALAWLLHRSPVILPIPGTHSVAHLGQNIAAQKILLDDEDMAALAAMA